MPSFVPVHEQLPELPQYVDRELLLDEAGSEA